MNARPITLFALLVGSGLTLSASGRPADRIDREDRTVEERPSLAVDFADLDSALELIPHGVLPTKTSDWTVAKHDVSNNVFTKRVVGRTIRLRLTVVEVSRLENSSSGYQVSCVGAGRDVTAYNLEPLLIFPATQCVDAARLCRGDEIVVRGVVKDSLFKVTAAGADFDCRLQLRLERIAVESFGEPKNAAEDVGERIRKSRTTGPQAEGDGERR